MTADDDSAEAMERCLHSLMLWCLAATNNEDRRMHMFGAANRRLEATGITHIDLERRSADLLEPCLYPSRSPFQRIGMGDMTILIKPNSATNREGDQERVRRMNLPHLSRIRLALGS